MYQAISTKYIAPTDHRGARVKAKSASGHAIVLDWDHDLNIERNHTVAAQKLATKLGWQGKWFGGGLDEGYVFVSTRNAKDSDFEVTLSQ